MASKTTVRNADGSVFRVRTAGSIIGTEFVVSHSAIGTAGGSLIRMDGRMYLSIRGSFVPISHDRYRYAGTDAEGARVALAFFAESYADTLAHAEAEGIDVRECFASE